MLEDTNFLDIGAGLYSLWGFRRGYAYGFAKQLRKLIDMATGALGGIGVYKGLGENLQDFLTMAPSIAKPASFLLSFGGAFVIVRTLRRQLKLLLLNKLRHLDEIWGALLGFGRNAILSGSGIFAAGIAPNGAMEGWAREGSLIGRFLFSLLGA